MGLVFAPKGVVKAPAIMLLHGSGGRHNGWTHLHAYRLAGAGFITLPFGYSVGGDLWFAGDIHDVELENTAAATRELRGLDIVNGKVRTLWRVTRGGACVAACKPHGARSNVGSRSA